MHKLSCCLSAEPSKSISCGLLRASHSRTPNRHSRSGAYTGGLYLLPRPMFVRLDRRAYQTPRRCPGAYTVKGQTLFESPSFCRGRPLLSHARMTVSIGIHAVFLRIFHTQMNRCFFKSHRQSQDIWLLSHEFLLCILERFLKGGSGL